MSPLQRPIYPRSVSNTCLLGGRKPQGMPRTQGIQTARRTHAGVKFQGLKFSSQQRAFLGMTIDRCTKRRSMCGRHRDQDRSLNPESLSQTDQPHRDSTPSPRSPKPLGRAAPCICMHFQRPGRFSPKETVCPPHITSRKVMPLSSLAHST